MIFRKGCIIGKDEIFLHCRKKIQENPKGDPLWSEWKATESFCNAENEYQQLTRQCIRGTCSGPWFMVKACDSCGKPIDGIKDYNEDYYSASSYSSSYNDNDEQVDNNYGDGF
ncbi:Oidioi.mRNA.OKI2018_I69.XSR.g15233.t1.cds [Oikopleura dioica]|uniref:Oidioi.mRNA.OKI2018_I69.XSR.g15233.t1.cds n=1 Tax=Oikopleura dioica TaxID=34765 RepID=A0ABN7SC55_OIKDI|nr:Oidioi.mRNA.OKI2018_I69.XSR.g15233.t1.cds [Oikopleura dioica]